MRPLEEFIDLDGIFQSYTTGHAAENWFLVAPYKDSMIASWLHEFRWSWSHDVHHGYFLAYRVFEATALNGGGGDSAWHRIVPTTTDDAWSDPTHPYYYLEYEAAHWTGDITNLLRNYGHGTPLDNAPMYKVARTGATFRNSHKSFADWAAEGSVLATILLDGLP